MCVCAKRCYNQGEMVSENFKVSQIFLIFLGGNRPFDELEMIGSWLSFFFAFVTCFSRWLRGFARDQL